MNDKQIKYLKIIQESYVKGLITKKDWKKERKYVREIRKVREVRV